MVESAEQIAIGQSSDYYTFTLKYPSFSRRGVYECYEFIKTATGQKVTSVKGAFVSKD